MRIIEEFIWSAFGAVIILALMIYIPLIWEHRDKPVKITRNEDTRN